MFFGTYTPKLDDKGRLTLPAKFRDALATRFPPAHARAILELCEDAARLERLPAHEFMNQTVIPT